MRRGSRVPSWLSGLSLGAASAFWLLCVAVPVGAVFTRAEGLGLLLEPSVLAVARITAGQAALSTAISAALGLALGLWIGARPEKQAGPALIALSLPFGVPSVVAAMAWTTWLGRSGPLAGLDFSYSFRAVVLAHVFYNVPWIALLVAQARRSLPRRHLEAAATLGAGPWLRLVRIVWPSVQWGFLSACAQAFSFCAMSFAVVLLLGGGPPVQTLETALFARMRYGELDVSGAVACAIWQILLTLTPWVLVLIFRGREEREIPLSGTEPAEAPALRGRGGWPDWRPVAAASVFVLPYFAVYAGNFTGASRAGMEIASELARPLSVSLRIAAWTGALSILAAVASLLALSFTPGLRRLGSVLITVPSGISALVLGLGIWIAYGDWLDPFAGSWVAIIAVQVTLFFVIPFRILWPLAQATPGARLDAAATLGAGPLTAFWLVDFPRWKGPLFAAFGMVVAASLGEVAAVSLFHSEEIVPLPLLVSRWMAQYRFDDARAVAALLFTLSWLTLTLIGFSSRGFMNANRRPI